MLDMQYLIVQFMVHVLEVGSQTLNYAVKKNVVDVLKQVTKKQLDKVKNILK
jgi:hypothetical protein